MSNLTHFAERMRQLSRSADARKEWNRRPESFPGRRADQPPPRPVLSKPGAETNAARDDESRPIWSGSRRAAAITPSVDAPRIAGPAPDVYRVMVPGHPRRAAGASSLTLRRSLYSGVSGLRQPW